MGGVLLQCVALALNFVSALATISMNKHVLKKVPFPAALTAMHYFISWSGVAALRHAGVFSRQAIATELRWFFAALVATWALCNALSNASLQRNSVGFYQLMKLTMTPLMVCIDYTCYGKTLTVARAAALVLACAGVGLATVSDVQLHLAGGLIACASVLTGLAQKVLSSHLQQRGGLSSLQLMDAAFPAMTAVGVLVVPAMDKATLLELHWYTAPNLALIGVSGIAAFCVNYFTTLVLRVASPLALVLLGQLKTCSVLLVGALLFDARPTAQGMMGSATAVLGIAIYTVLTTDWKGKGSPSYQPLPVASAAAEKAEEDGPEDGPESAPKGAVVLGKVSPA